MNNNDSAIIDSLNQIMDTSNILSEADLQDELSIFANVQFTYDNKKASERDIHSLIHHKLASLVDHNNPTMMSPDAISRFYDHSPVCSPPNGYYSPNVSPPNISPNPTPPNGLLPGQQSDMFEAIINPPIAIYDQTVHSEYDEKEFMETMKALSGQHQESQDATEEDQSGRRKSIQPLSKEDKRRRNTAASARFRVKKKLREQALQQTAAEMTEKARVFEERVHELEREVKWLKALLVEKKDGQIEQMILNQQKRELEQQQQQQSS
ncbi:Putative Regulatory protein cys-3 [Rhizopus microsporus]|nr:Putative Regulatory protein cys-3 [Rhizopus microsporus]